jgi:hypothetical protein
MISLIWFTAALVGMICLLVLLYYFIKMLALNIRKMDFDSNQKSFEESLKLLDDYIRITVISIKPNNS